MKSFFNCLILCGLVILVGCSGGSPSQPATPTTTQTDVWSITSLEASDSNPIVNTAVTVTATVTLNGSPVPDDTQVEFTANGGVFSNGETLATVLSSGGQASVGFGATDPGPYSVQARVRTVTRQITITYRNPDQTGGLQMYSINPSAGSYAGGEPVILTGKGIRNPVEVTFTVQGTQYQAIVDQVVESVPATAEGTITIRTPQPTAADTTLTSSADVRVTVGIGTTNEESQSYPSVFTFISDSVTIGDPVIFGVEPLYGRSQGGESVTILGLNFAVDTTKELEKNFNEVYFNFQGQRLLAQVEQWSETQIAVITPRFSLTPLTENLTAGVVLTRRDGGADVVKDNIFIVKSDVAEPEITGISPTAGPMDGGTVVTITGHGFELPLQVHFGDLEATGVQLFDDQSLADNDVITCLTPDYSQLNQVPPIFVSVRVTNLQTGNSATSSQTFRYGDVLYVGQANPTEGQIGDLFTLFGAGFEDPLTVWFLAGGDTEFDVISVTGTELTLRSPTDMPPTCEDRSGSFRVVLNESNRQAEGGQYTLLGSQPTITAVEPIFVDETDFGNGVSPGEIDIYGVRFADELLVRINNYTIAPNDVIVETAEHIHVNQIPAPNDFGLVFNTGSCTTGTGLQGIRNEPTPVNVTVRNLPLGCEDTLVAGLVYVPEDQTCVAAPNLSASIPAFPATEFPGPSAPQTLIINNAGGGDLMVSGIFLSGQFFFDAGCANQAAPAFTVPAFTNGFMGPDVYFCPAANNGEVYPGELRIISNNVNSPYAIPLSGQEAFPILGVTTNDLSFPGPYPQQLTFDVTNTGTGDLNYTANLAGANFSIVSGGSGLVAAGGSATVTIEAAADSSSGTVTVSATEPDAQGSPQVVNLDAPAP